MRKTRKSRSFLIIIFLVLFSAVLPIQAAKDEGYGEDETSLGQFVDSFETSGNISVAVDVIRNSTLEVMELNITDVVEVIYNLTSLREHDLYGGSFSVNVVYSINNNDELRMINSGGSKVGDGYVFLTVDSSWLDDKYVRFRWYPYANIINNGYKRQYLKVFDGRYDRSNNTDFPAGSAIPLKGNGELFSYKNTNALNAWGTKDFQIDTSGGVLDNVTVAWFIHDAWSATIIGLYLDWIEINDGPGGSDNLILINFNNSSPITMEVSGTEGDYGFANSPELPYSTGGYAESGYFTTVDYLSDPLANGSALVHLTNTTIPDGTGILVEFSDDNSTWIFNDWQPIFGGFEAIDLRDLNYSTGFYIRYNLSTSNSAITPRLYQSRLITTIGQAGTPGGPNVLNGTWIDYNLTEIAVTRGTLDSGNLASTYFIDGNMFNVSEVAMVPGMTILANITGIDDNAISLWITIYALYDGNLNHDFDIEVWDFTNSVWVEDSHIEDGVAMEWVNSTIYDLRIPVDFLNAGEVRIRLDHESPGNSNHDLFIDYFRVQAFVPTGLAVAGVGVGANWGLLWFFLILICVPILLVLLKGSKR